MDACAVGSECGGDGLANTTCAAGHYGSLSVQTKCVQSHRLCNPAQNQKSKYQKWRVARVEAMECLGKQAHARRAVPDASGKGRKLVLGGTEPGNFSGTELGDS